MTCPICKSQDCKPILVLGVNGPMWKCLACNQIFGENWTAPKIEVIQPKRKGKR